MIKLIHLTRALRFEQRFPSRDPVGPRHDVAARQAEMDESEPTRCPWCGAMGVDFDENPAPSDYCGHDPAALR